MEKFLIIILIFWQNWKVKKCYCMSMIIDQLKNKDNFTFQEKLVADFIIKEPWSLIDMTLHDLSLATFTSDPTIMRLCKKCGFKGYSDFKNHFVLEYNSMLNNRIDKLDEFNKQVLSHKEFYELYPNSVSQNIANVAKSLSASKINRIVQTMMSAKKVLIFATNYSNHIAQIYRMKFGELGLDVSVHDSNDFYLFSYIQTNQISTYAFVITVSGENTLSQEIIPKLIEFNIPYCFISRNPDAPGAKKSNEFILIDNHYSDIMDRGYFAFGLNYVLESIYLFSYLSEIKDLQKRIDTTHRMFPDFYKKPYNQKRKG